MLSSLAWPSCPLLLFCILHLRRDSSLTASSLRNIPCIAHTWTVLSVMLLFCHSAPAQTPPAGSTCWSWSPCSPTSTSLPARLPALSSSLPLLSRCVNSQVGLVAMAPAPSTPLSVLLPAPLPPPLPKKAFSYFLQLIRILPKFRTSSNSTVSRRLSFPKRRLPLQPSLSGQAHGSDGSEHVREAGLPPAGIAAVWGRGCGWLSLSLTAFQEQFAHVT